MWGILLRTWALEDFGFPIHEIDIDPSNNLLVGVYKQIPLLGRHYSSVKLALNLEGEYPLFSGSS
jgi:hypothetical protein